MEVGAQQPDKEKFDKETLDKELINKGVEKKRIETPSTLDPAEADELKGLVSRYNGQKTKFHKTYYDYNTPDATELEFSDVMSNLKKFNAKLRAELEEK